MSDENVPNNEPDYFDIVREQLRYWPYTVHQIDDTLDVSLIEGRGKQLLFRAIHSNNLTAFAGSGLSMSYGRLGWSEWEKEQKRVVSRSAIAFINLSKASLLWNKTLQNLLDDKLYKCHDGLTPKFFDLHQIFRSIPCKKDNGKETPLTAIDRHNLLQWLRSQYNAIEYAQRQIVRLDQTYNLTQSQDGHFPGGEELPVKFEIAQQLHNQLRVFSGLFLATQDKMNQQQGALEEIDKTKMYFNAWAGCYQSQVNNAAPLKALEALRCVIENRGSEWKAELVKLKAADGGAGRNYFAIPREIRVFIEKRNHYKNMLGSFAEALNGAAAEQSFEQLAKSLLIDECPHAFFILRNGLLKSYDIDDVSRNDDQWRDMIVKIQNLESRLRIVSEANQKRDIDGIRQNPERYRVLSPFKLENVAKLVKNIEPPSIYSNHWDGFWRVFGGRLSEYIRRERLTEAGRVYLTPSTRFIVSLCLHFYSDPFKALGIVDKKITDEELEEYFSLPSRADFTARRSIIADRFDPLAKTERKMGINCYITTNYDFEIERYFQDQGYRNFPPPESHDPELHQIKSAVDPDEFQADKIGRTLVDRCFTADRASELTGFALDNNKSGASVFHLHGRASREDRLVITERDYMKLYLTQDENRETIDEGISVAFSGAPLLFLGLGMEETDLLRPLRQFISNRDRTVGYTSIALLPADKSTAARAKFASSLYLRYGVHTIFYGSGTVETEGAATGIDWLCRIVALIEGLRSEISIWEKDDLAGKHRGSKQILKDLYKTVDVIGPELAESEEKASEYALNFLLGLKGDCTIDEALAGLTTEYKKTNASGDLSQKGIHDNEFIKYPKLQVCTFTPSRPRDNPKYTHRTESEATIEGEKYLGLYTELLDSVFKIVVLGGPDMLASSVGKDPKVVEERRAAIAPIKTALNGLHSAIMTACLNAALDGISREKDAWWKSWQEPPPERIAEASFELVKKSEGTDNRFLAMTFVRHRVDNTLTGMKTAEDDPLPVGKDKYLWLMDASIGDTEPARICHENRTMIRSFDTFIAALKCTFDKEQLEPDPHRRLLVTIAARRGMGKGTFMSAFATQRGKRLYETAAWKNQRWKNRDSSIFIAGYLFINMGFSPEVASAYDMICDATIKVIDALRQDMAEAHDTPNIDIRSEIAGLSRIASLKSVFLRFKNTSDEYYSKKVRRRPRLLVNLSAIDLLFDKNRRAKNGEIDRIFDLIFSNDLKDCPIDFVFVADDLSLGSHWSMENSQQTRVRLERDRLREVAEEGIQRAIITSRIKVDDNRSPGLYERDSFATRQEHHFVHFTRPVNAVSLLNSNFPVLAATMYLDKPPGRGHFPIRADIWGEVSDVILKARQCSDQQMREAWSNPSYVPDSRKLAKIRNKIWEDFETKFGGEIREHAESIGIKEKPDADITLILRARLSDEHNAADMHEWRAIRRDMGNSRFALTILLAAAEQIIVYAEEAQVGVEQAKALIRSTVAEVRGVGVEKRDQMVLDSVLDSYRQFHSIGDPDLDCELHLLIIRHLGVIGTPVGGAVLVRLPEVREYFERLGVETDVSRRRFLVRSLTVLAHRGLVFRLEPNPWLKLHDNAKDWPETQEYRYALHRVVQNFALEGLKTGTSDPVRNNTFAPSLYAVMSPTGPRLSRDTYRFLRTLMIGLSQYPDVATTDANAQPWLFTTGDRSIRIQALRAAMTLTRSIFSVAVVSRMSDQKPISDSLQKRGYLETYKVRLRWIIRMAWESVYPEQKKAFKEEGVPYKQINALYLDEIVWIYNELGVVSLAQGSLSDSLGYLRQAAEQNERIEGRSRNSPIFNHIDLNHAIVQIERGSFKSARFRLERVLEATRERAFNVHYTALGYQCVLNHLSGIRDGVREDFARTVNHFVRSNETRAAALFLMHEGGFIAEGDYITAIQNITRARDMAETDGHEDVRHHIELARIRVKTQWMPDRKHDARDLGVILKVESFARRMSIWSLQVDALRLRAQLLLEQGETSTAGRLLSRAMAVAKRHALTLRLNSCMTTYADTLRIRGDVESAKRMALSSLSLAKQTGYSLETSRAQRVLRDSK